MPDGAQVGIGTKLAVVEAPSGRFALLTNGKGFLREKLFPAGAHLPAGSPIAVVDADGEDMPYGGLYSRLEPLDP